MEYTFKTTLTLDSELIEEVIETAGYGIGYWARTAHHDGLAETYTLSWDGSDFEDNDPNSAGEHLLDYSDIAKAIEALYSHTYSVRSDLHTQLNEWLIGEESMDSDLADVIIQVALFDEIIYG
jgi:hypothetical protein